jgi:hypothetical protein
MTGTPPKRSTLSLDQARQRYVELGELAALEQICDDAALIDARKIAVGPFARLDAEKVAARDGKTRGAITNVFGSQAGFQQATMALALSATALIDEIDYPRPTDFSTAEDWVRALFLGQAARGPQHGAHPEMGYQAVWALWLALVPYGLWSRAVSEDSVAEFASWSASLEQAFGGALDHFGLRLREGTTLQALSCAAANLIEGAWLNQCLTPTHPIDPARPVSDALLDSGVMLWRGAVG